MYLQSTPHSVNTEKAEKESIAGTKRQLAAVEDGRQSF
jgi:hypothetical protein